MIKTAEFVSPKHPDKICDFIADSILDAYLAGDKKSRVAVEVMGGHGVITISGEITSNTSVKIPEIVQNIVGNEYKVNVNCVEQSNFIAQGVDTGGAGDQGIMIGYATSETPNFMPFEYELARTLCKGIYEKYPYDGKTQVTVENGAIKTVVVSFQNTQSNKLEQLVRTIITAKDLSAGASAKTEYLMNPSGEWIMGGFDSDSGISGRKIVIDAYGPEISVGGGSFSGKDYTKVDRSGAYMARRIAVDLLKKYNAREVRTKLAYAIGKKEPVMVVAEIDGTEMLITGYDVSPRGIYEFLRLDTIRFADTAVWGHFGREFPWR